MLERIRSRLQYKLMLGFSAVLLAALSLISFYAQLSARDMLITHTRSDQLRLAAVRIAAAEWLLRGVHADLLALSRAPDTLDYFRGALDDAGISERLIDSLAQAGHHYVGICLSDVAGQGLICARVQAGKPVLVPVDVYEAGLNPLPLATSGQTLDQAPGYSVAITRLSAQNPAGPAIPVLRYRAAVYNQVGKQVGQVILDASAQTIFDLLLDADGITTTSIVDRDGGYILGAAASNLRDERPASAAEILSYPMGTLFDPADQRKVLTTYDQLNFPGQRAPVWVVIYDQPVDSLMASINQVLLVNVVLTLALLILGLLITYGLTRSIVRPVRALVAAAERVGAGDLQAPITTTSSDEIGALAQTLDRTVARLRSTLGSAESRRREAETLYTTAIALSSTLDLHRLLDRILDELRSVVPYDSSTVQLVRGDQVEIIGAYGLVSPEKLIGTTFPLSGAGPNAEVARLRTTLILDDAPTVFARFNEEPYRADPIRSWIGVPLIFGERLVGMITIDKYEPGFYTPEHARIATAFAAQAAIALENARLYEAIRDELTERRRSEQAQMRLTAILEATTDVVGSADTRGRMLFLNRAGRRLFGIGEHEDVVGRPIGDYVTNESLSQILSAGAPVAMRDGIWSGEIMLCRSDGSEIPASQVIVAHRDGTGRTEYFSTILRDISERLRAEEQLRQAQKMEAVGRLAGGVSHDFNNILTVIMGECDLMLHEPGLSPDLRLGLDQIRQAGARAASLTRQLLAFSRRQVLQPTTINLNDIVVPIEQMLRRLISEDIALLTCLAQNLADVRADPSQIEQVILNLCINGRDAMPSGGELHLITENMTFAPGNDHDLPPGDYVRLTVRDTGAGIDDHVREHIFEPFFTTKPRGKGTGLGLATVHGIVQQSGGIIRFSSLLGQGTSFYVYLPAVAEQRSTTPHLPVNHPSFSNIVVLLVEDDDRVRKLTHQILSSQGLTVIDAADGSAALRACAQHKGNLDLLISDIVMPGGLNGPQLAAHIRASRPQTRVLLMSGYTDDAFSAATEIDPDIHFIQKPFTPAYLIEKVAETLDASAGGSISFGDPLS